VTRPRAYASGEKRDDADVRENDGFFKKFLAVEESRILPVPMPPKDGGKGTFPLRNDEIRRNTATLGTGVRDIVDGDVPAMFHIDFLDIQRRLGIIIKGAGRTGVLREQRCCAKEKGGC